MWWLFTFTRRLALATACITGIILAAHAHPADAQSLETAIMPGEVIQGHANTSPIARTAMSLRTRRPDTTFVSTATRMWQRTCAARRVITAASGSRYAEPVIPNTRVVARGLSFWMKGNSTMRGRTSRSSQACRRYVPELPSRRTKHRAAPSDCVGCHRKDDKHKDTLGPKCENCHDARSWKEARFDHDKARFPFCTAISGQVCRMPRGSTALRQHPARLLLVPSQGRQA